MRPTGTTHSTGLHGRALHGTWLHSAALGARCMALGCDEGPGLASWLLCSESPAHCACGTRALTHPFVSHLLDRKGGTHRKAGEELVD